MDLTNFVLTTKEMSWIVKCEPRDTAKLDP